MLYRYTVTNARTVCSTKCIVQKMSLRFFCTSVERSRSAALANAFQTISMARCAEKNFLPDIIPINIMMRILNLTQMAPSSFNIQPYRVVLVQSPEAKAALATCMLGYNSDKVLIAPITAVFIADKGNTYSMNRI